MQLYCIIVDMKNDKDENPTVIEPADGRDGDERRTFVEASKDPPGAERNAAIGEGGGGGKNLVLNDRKYRIVERVEKISTEAELFIVENEERKKFILKSYRHGIVPKREVLETLRRLSLKDVIEVYETGNGSDGRFFEVQEFAEFGSLEEHIKRNRPLKEDFIVNAVAELNRCLREIHSHRIVHRDVKPSNVLIRSLRPLDLVLTDFGISSIAELAMHQTSLNRTITYSSPESMTGVVSAASDYWALGMIALEMAIGKHPYEKMDEKAVMYSLVTRPVPFAETVSGRLSDLVRGLLTRDAAKRWGEREIGDWLTGKKGIAVYFESPAADDSISTAAATAAAKAPAVGTVDDRETLSWPQKKAAPGAIGETDRKSVSYKFCSIFFTIASACLASLALGYTGMAVGAMVGMYRDGRFNMNSILHESAVVGSYVGLTLGVVAGFAMTCRPGKKKSGAALFTAIFEAAVLGTIGYYLFWYLGEATGVIMVVYGHWRTLITGSYAYTGRNVGSIAGALIGLYYGSALGEYVYGKVFYKKF